MEERESPSASRVQSPSKRFERSTVNFEVSANTSREERSLLLHNRSCHAAADPGLREGDDLEILLRKLRQKYRTLALGWRDGLDVHSSHAIGKAEWFKGLRRIGYGGNALVVWQLLAGRRKQVTLADLDPNAASLLSGFYGSYVREIGPVGEMLRGMDGLRTDKTGFMDFCAPLRRSTKKREAPIDVGAVFRCLESIAGCVSQSDLQWLEGYCTRSSEPGPARADARGPGCDSESQACTEERTNQRSRARRRRGLKEFRTILQHRCGGTVHAWRSILDRGGIGSISLEELQVVTEAIDFPHGAADIWEELAAGKERITLKDWCPEGPAAHKEFLRKCADCHGTVGAALKILAPDQEPIATREQFCKFSASIGLHANPHLLCDYLDERGVGSVLLSSIDLEVTTKLFGFKAMSMAQEEYVDLAPLPSKQPYMPISEQQEERCGAARRPPDDQRSLREELLVLLQTRWASPVRAWACVLDAKGRGKLTKEQFFVGCSVAGFTASKNDLWRELGLRDGQSIRLRDLVPEVLQNCGHFRHTAGKQLARFIATTEAEQGAQAKKDGAEVGEEQFHELCQKVGYKQDWRFLMSHFDLEAKGTVNTKTLRAFFDEKKDEKALVSLVRRHNKLKRDTWRSTMEAARVAPGSEVLAKQDAMIEAGRRKREAAVKPEASRRELLSQLSRRFGSIARAWKQVLNPNNSPDISFNIFLDGLKRAGVVSSKASDSHVQVFLTLYNYLLAADEKATGLKLSHLDPRVEESIDEFKIRACERFGSLWQGFDKADPEGTGEISHEAFRMLCQESKVTDGVHRMLHYFDPDGEGSIRLDAIDAASATDAQEACKERRASAEAHRGGGDGRAGGPGQKHFADAGPDDEAADDVKQLDAVRRLREALVEQHGTLPRAWREAFGLDVQDKIDLKTFRGALKDIDVEDDPEDLWKALLANGAKCGGKPGRKGPLTFLHLDPSYRADVAELSGRLRERFGSALNAMRHLHEYGYASLEFGGLRSFCGEMQYRRNVHRLFDFLSADGITVSIGSFDRAAATEFRQILAARRSAGEGEELDSDQDPETPQAMSAPTVEIADRPDPAAAFRTCLAQRFGGDMIKAWRSLDPDRRAVLRVSEFRRNIAATGFSGSPTTLWSALVGEGDELSLMELDPDLCGQLSTFKRVANRVHGSLKGLFKDRHSAPDGQVDLNRWIKLCRKLSVPTPWESLFEQLSVNGVMTIDSVGFLEDTWAEQNGVERPVRQAGNPWVPPPRHQKAPANPAFYNCPLSQSMRSSKRPPCVMKSSSLPHLSQPIRANWNDRHEILDHRGNKEEQTLHLMMHVNCQEAERCKRKVAQRMAQEPLMRWLTKNCASSGSDDESDDD